MLRLTPLYQDGTSVLRLTIGKENHPGKSTPNIAFHSKKGMRVAFFDGTETVSHYIKDKPLLDQWTTIGISQELSEEKYIFKILLENNLVHSVEIDNPQSFDNVKVYASSPWRTAQPGSIKDLTIEIKDCKTIVLSEDSFGGLATYQASNVLTAEADKLISGVANYWLAGTGQEHFILDLGCIKTLNTVEMINTRNALSNNRSTKDFR